MSTPPFVIELSVRDYECDMEGIVNNAVYLNYLEHARHEFLRGTGIDFAALVARGVHLVVTRVEADYLKPLRSGDRFRVTVRVERESRLRFAFVQQILRADDDVALLRARVIGTGILPTGRPGLPQELIALLDGAGPAVPAQSAIS